ncbi:MazG-like family protein [Bacillus sp. DX1.1]|uniref:MazG-like family protein n=1 Tax=unclassified Bacillus (in: firmicutes) TaxID=185979 RepID=UPI00256FE750|nr:MULTISPECIES: MazG-like family protein [unclassified Bacillus (in: firmicutes)]MDM5157167.1 MazG-like family protein [Bacillus sp. DX1.1]WJE81399.1 MazG-like family protein [Bacillus sp. DX3.1]
MNIAEFQRWVEEFYEKRSWSQYNSFIRLNFLTEEVGEVSRVVRAIEIGRDRPDEQAKQEDELLIDLKEEIGDVLANLIVLSQKYDLDLQDIMEAHVEKLSNRFQ